MYFLYIINANPSPTTLKFRKPALGMNAEVNRKAKVQKRTGSNGTKLGVLHRLVQAIIITRLVRGIKLGAYGLPNRARSE